MFSADAVIDTVQNGKKNWVNAVVPHEDTRRAMNSFIDDQTEYAKTVSKITADWTAKAASEGWRMWNEMARFDYTKAAATTAKTKSADK